MSFEQKSELLEKKSDVHIVRGNVKIGKSCAFKNYCASLVIWF
jgi:hypothetical protein